MSRNVINFNCVQLLISQLYVIQISNMYSKIRTFRTTEQQHETLNKMKSYNVDVSRFIREAIKEKLQRESIKLVKNTNINISKDCGKLLSDLKIMS